MGSGLGEDFALFQPVGGDVRLDQPVCVQAFRLRARSNCVEDVRGQHGQIGDHARTMRRRAFFVRNLSQGFAIDDHSQPSLRGHDDPHDGWVLIYAL